MGSDYPVWRFVTINAFMPRRELRFWAISTIVERTELTLTARAMNSPQPTSLPPEGPTFRRSAATQRNAPWIVVGVAVAAFVCLAFVVALVGQSDPVKEAKATREPPLTLHEPERRREKPAQLSKPSLPPVKPVKDDPWASAPKELTAHPSKAETEAKVMPFKDLPKKPKPKDDSEILPAVLKPVGAAPAPPAALGDDPQIAALANEVIDQLLIALRTDPSVPNRVNAATSLGRRSEAPDKIVPVILEAARRDPSSLVRIECVKAFGKLDDLGKSEATVLGFLRDIVFEAESGENRRVAADALLEVAPQSAEAKQVLRAALVGSKGASPISAVELGGPGILGDIFDWREWAYDKLRDSPTESAWAVPLLIKISEREIGATTGGDRTHQHLELTATAMVDLGDGSPAVQAHLKKCVYVVLPEKDGSEHLIVFYDSLLKRMEAEKAEKAANP